MSGSDDSIDFSKFRSNQEEVEHKRERFINFTSFIGGLILGAIVSFPLQLLIRPLSYENSALTYGPSVLINPAPVWLVPVISILLLLIMIFLIISGYVGWLGIVGQETVEMSYECSNYDSFYEDMRDYLDEESKFIDVEVKAKNDWIKCMDPGRQPDAEFIAWPVSLFGPPLLVDLTIEYLFPKAIIKLNFNSELSVVELRYDPNSENANHLLEKLESRY